MLSDIHFDPFHDPAKFAKLREAPAEDWAAILSAPASPTQVADFANLQRGCHARGVDTPWPLLQSSLHAARTEQPAPLFVTVSGDLMAHLFDCRFHALAPKASAADYSAFAAKTVAFVSLELHHAFPHTPIYLALGNNDSGCGDYKESPHSPFLQAVAQSVAADALAPANRDAILATFSDLGDYNIELPAPIEHTRLIVLQNIFESKSYNACPGTPVDANMSPREMQISWLRTQLTSARAAHEHVWVMAHIPPGIDLYNIIRGGKDVCSGAAPSMFLGSEALADALTDFPDVIRLALFAHTHMDEMRLFEKMATRPFESAANDVTITEPAGDVPGKLVPSISPVDGNNPAFTIAQVEPRSATLKDYEVFAASNQTGVDTHWTREYRFSTTYKEPDFSGKSLAHLTAAMVADKSGAASASTDYQQFYFVGGATSISASLKAAAMKFLWPSYACSIRETHIAGFRTCSCPTVPTPTP
jgi:sphingomyelin phosphodiesterase acid-like 3